MFSLIFLTGIVLSLPSKIFLFLSFLFVLSVYLVVVKGDWKGSIVPYNDSITPMWVGFWVGYLFYAVAFLAITINNYLLGQ